MHDSQPASERMGGPSPRSDEVSAVDGVCMMTKAERMYEIVLKPTGHGPRRIRAYGEV